MYNRKCGQSKIENFLIDRTYLRITEQEETTLFLPIDVSKEFFDKIYFINLIDLLLILDTCTSFRKFGCHNLQFVASGW